MDKNLITEVIERGVRRIIPSRDKLLKILKHGNKLNVYIGIDPTATKIHLGHSLHLRKLQKFLELGHNVTFLIGDFTALIGDTSDKDTERPILKKSEIENNFKTYKKQASKMLDFTKVRVVHNSEWLSLLNFEDLVKLVQHFSLGDFIGRELIKKRLESGKQVRLDETLYPVMQGYDSYYMNTDIQLGGADQIFNMQAGRTLQKELRGKESFIIVGEYLAGTDGRKMSKSWGNAIWIDDTPEEMYGKIMSIRDELIHQYLTLATNLSLKEVNHLVRESISKPAVIKKRLAYQIVSELHSADAAQHVQNNFVKTFQNKKPDFDTDIEARVDLLSTITPRVGSKSQAKRLISAGAVEVNGITIKEITKRLKSGDEIKIGVRQFYRVK